ncbi:MAG: energy transducer TonB [Verrucomicrobia bacterium]|nr:energy transducer TonB [Verrucomicrobiota bacterium]
MKTPLPVCLLLGSLALPPSLPGAAETAKPAPAGSEQPLDLSKLDQLPVPRFQARPRYPEAARKAKRSGEVLVDFIVDTKGEVRGARAVRSTSKEFEAAAIEAVSKWRFRPGRKGGRDVATHMQVPIVFSLEEKSASKSKN